MFSPRRIVSASVVALSMAVLAGNAIPANADNTASRSEEALVTSLGSVTEASQEMGFTVPHSYYSQEHLTTRAFKTVLPKAHKNFREANSTMATRVSGIKPSTYTGKYFSQSAESFRKCVIQRESRGYYRLVGGGDLTGDGKGDYQGAYQMSPALSNGVTYMMAKESKKSKDGLIPVIKELRGKPANKWSRYWQDRAYFTVINWEGNLSGAQHWAGAPHSC